MKIRINLSASSLDEAIKKVESYKKSISDKTLKACDKLADYGVEYAQKEISAMADYGNLTDIKNSIHKEQRGNKFYIVTRNIKAPFVEFGTGVRGSGNAHPEASQFGWGYMTGNFTEYNGKVGWWYPSTLGDGNITQKETESGDLIAFTQGMPARPFMYNTAKAVKRRAKETTKEVMGKK